MRKGLIVLAATLLLGGALIVGAAGFVAWQGATLAGRGAAAALEQAAPPEARERARARLDEALAALRSGRFDAAALREAAFCLPGALADGRLDAAERELLWSKLDRIAPPSA